MDAFAVSIAKGLTMKKVKISNAVLVGAMLAWVLAPETFWMSFLIFGSEVLAGEAAVLYILGVPLLLFFRRTGLMDRLLGRAAKAGQ